MQTLVKFPDYVSQAYTAFRTTYSFQKMRVGNAALCMSILGIYSGGILYTNYKVALNCV